MYFGFILTFWRLGIKEYYGLAWFWIKWSGFDEYLGKEYHDSNPFKGAITRNILGVVNANMSVKRKHGNWKNKNQGLASFLLVLLMGLCFEEKRAERKFDFFFLLAWNKHVWTTTIHHYFNNQLRKKIQTKNKHGFSLSGIKLGLDSMTCNYEPIWCFASNS